MVEIANQPRQQGGPLEEGTRGRRTSAQRELPAAPRVRNAAVVLQPVRGQTKPLRHLEQLAGRCEKMSDIGLRCLVDLDHRRVRGNGGPGDTMVDRRRKALQNQIGDPGRHGRILQRAEAV